MTRPTIEFETIDENESVAKISGEFCLLREDKDEFQTELENLIEKYAI